MLRGTNSQQSKRSRVLYLIIVNYNKNNDVSREDNRSSQNNHSLKECNRFGKLSVMVIERLTNREGL